jgi:hypothetical protein
LFASSKPPLVNVLSMPKDSHTPPILAIFFLRLAQLFFPLDKRFMLTSEAHPHFAKNANCKRRIQGQGTVFSVPPQFPNITNYPSPHLRKLQNFSSVRKIAKPKKNQTPFSLKPL